jgi:sec-independent protein translocase protein TatA
MQAFLLHCLRRETMGELFTPTHLLLVLVVALLLFGPRKLPELGKGLGEGIRGFKEGIKGINNEDASKTDTAATKSTTTENK